MGSVKPRRKRPLLRMKSKKTAASRQPREKEREDLAFSQMVPAWAFDVYLDQLDQGHGFHRVLFRKGDDVMLHSPWDDTQDVWIGRICQIRTTLDRQNTLVKVRWYWSGNDIVKHIKSFDPNKCAPYERILSDDYDYVSPYAFERVVHVHEYDESSLDPPMLGPKDLFMRSTLVYRKKAFKPPLGAGTCFCQGTYNPFPTSLVTTSPGGTLMTRPQVDGDVMHFCPNPNCRKWYHQSCLNSGTQAHLDVLPPQSRRLRLLAVNPDEEVLFTTFAYFYEQESRDDTSCAEQITLAAALEMLNHRSDVISHLPPGLLAIAQLPIVRMAGADAGFAIGNVSDVVLARRFVYAAVQHSGPPQCDTKFFGLLMRLQAQEQLAFWSGTTDEDADIAFLQQLCDDLEEVGPLLASPRHRYWDERYEVYKEMHALFEGPAFVCPQCRGAI